MLSHCDLKNIAKERFKDAKFLFHEKRYDAALYICGYSVELILKAVICKELRLKGLPGSSAEFETVIDTLQKVKTHNLETLLSLTNTSIQKEVKNVYFTEWGNVQNWNPEIRYVPIRGVLLKPEAEKIIKSSRKLLGFFNKKL